MQQWRGLWLPDGETHLIGWMQKVNQVVNGKPTYQRDKLKMALAHVKQKRAAVDIGAHCGLISMQLTGQFDVIHAFEPVEAHRDCFKKNVPATGTTVALYSYALGEKPGKVSIRTAPTSSGDSFVDGDGEIEMRCLDELGLQVVDFMKLDCEGYELFALRGAEETLKRCKPCVMVEQKPGKAQQFGLPETGAVDYLQSLGARLRAQKSGDYVLSWD